MKKWASLILIAVWSFTFPSSAFSMAQQKKMPLLENSRLDGLVHAPDFPAHLDWLNTDHPFSLQDFKGKLVLLDFWTFCCINCMHVIPDLKKLEAKYPNELVVIGVHSAKFFNEKGTDSIRQAIMRYGIKHPVINDKDMEIWSQYGVTAWPTLVLINPNGRIIGVQSGEQVFDLFDGIISQAIAYFDKKGQLKRGPLSLTLEASKHPDSLLSFPGKIRADAEKNLLYISDSNHNRILISNLSGKIQQRIGNGSEGQEDGSFESASFNHPQGIFAEGDLLYIADTENHLIRVADFKTRQVKTVLGTGEQAREAGSRGQGRTVALNSPWDLLIHQGKLYIAMAGPHQIYEADLQTWETKPYAGSGREARVDGPLLQAALAQPSGITRDDKKLYFADSEVSSIRSADLDPDGKVETLIGKDLFEFGDVDGAQEKARLQHALGIDFSEGLLYVADTYNSKIKMIDPLKKTSTTLAGIGKHGSEDGDFDQASFFEPGGLSVLNKKIYVADTNNHQIRVLDLETRKVSTLSLSGLEEEKPTSSSPFRAEILDWPSIVLGEGKSQFKISFNLPQGYHWNLQAPSHVEWKSQSGNLIFKTSAWDPNVMEFPHTVSTEAKQGKDQFELNASLYFCREASAICLFQNFKLRAPIEIKASGPGEVDLQIPIKVKS